MLGRGLRRRFGGPGAWAGAVVVLLLVGVVTLVSGAPYWIASDDAQRPPLEERLTQVEFPTGTTLDDLETARVAEIVDGDTITARLEDGRTLLVRYFGIDTPERGERCFREATDRNEMLVAGKTVLLLTDERLEDTNGRLLRYIFLEDGTSVDATLVAEGFAEAWRADGYYRDQIVALEDEARSAGRGCLW
jgi:endonuclease YncB( thermonuclease family)